MTRPFPRLIAALGAAAIAVITGGATEPARNWATTVTATPEGAHVVGNPAAKVRLVEYASYTCPHCAHFEREGAAALQIVYARSGKVAWEYRHLVRDPLDLAVAMLVNCAPRERFFRASNAYFSAQPTWLGRAVAASATQQARWRAKDLGARNRAIAADLGLYPIAERTGVSRGAADLCLADAALAKRLAAMTAAAEPLGIDSTPSFLINGEVLVGTHEWTTLRPQLDTRVGG